MATVASTVEAPNEIYHQLTHWFLRGCLKSVDDGHQQRTTPTYTKSSPMSRAKGSDELIRTEITMLRFHQAMKMLP